LDDKRSTTRSENCPMPWVNRKIRLKTRFMISSGTVLFVLMAIIVLLVGRRFSQSIREEVKGRGLAVAQSIAAVSTGALLTYNYVALEQNAEQASQGADLVYVIILNKEGSVAAFSGHEGWQGKSLDDPVNRLALVAASPLVQPLIWEETGERALDVVVPVFIAGSTMKWGTVRVGLSLEPMYRQIRRTQLLLVAVGVVALLLGIAGSHLLASRITQPLARVVEATIAAAAGDLNQNLEIHTRDEVEELAKNFNIMIRELLAQRQQLVERLEEILQLKHYNDMTLASMTNGLITLDLEGKLVSANAAAEAIFRLGGRHWQGLNFRQLWPEESHLVQILTQSLRSQIPCRNREIALERDTGQQRTLMVNTSFLRDAREATVGLLAVFNDITELKAMEARIRQTDRLAALGTLSAGLAHEIRNPLSAIKTFVQLLPKKISSPAFLDKFQVTVPRELNRINDLIENLLELARPPKMKFTEVSPSSLLRQVGDLYRDELEEAKVSLLIEEQGQLPEIRADGEHLVRAFSNLLRNARQAMPEGGRLTIRAEPQGTGVIIQFIDTGVGMDAATADNIFNPFFTTKDKGTGLGLAITHKIIQEHGGTIQVASALGAGTTITLTFPGMQG
jgi:PAS domain S-box-containing protein